MRAVTTTRRRALVLVAALVAVVGLVTGATVAASKSSLAAPTITAAPAANSGSASATFAFTGPGGASFQCSLDNAAYTSCTSPKAYSALAQGSHTFAVKALKGSDVSDPTAYTWKVDTVAPPAPSLTAKPSNLSNTANPSFVFTDAEPGVTFRCGLDGVTPGACTTPKSYSGLAQGSHTFAVLAVDAAGNVGITTTFTWAIDTIAPGAPTITQKPTDPTSNATNTFAWTGAEAGVTSQCSLENGAWFTCTSPYTWVIDTTNYGQHQFAVRSIDAAGNISAGTYYSFKYEKGLPTSGVPFQISGNVTGLTIGLWRPVAVTITNPNPVTIFVTQLTMAVSADSTPSGCASATNVELQQSTISGAQVVTVPANGSVTLPAQGATTPQIRIRNLSTVNQDVCKNKTFGLTFSGTANN